MIHRTQDKKYQFTCLLVRSQAKRWQCQCHLKERQLINFRISKRSTRKTRRGKESGAPAAKSQQLALLYSALAQLVLEGSSSATTSQAAIWQPISLILQ